MLSASESFKNILGQASKEVTFKNVDDLFALKFDYVENYNMFVMTSLVTKLDDNALADSD
mgnify:CR=1 FL=1